MENVKKNEGQEAEAQNPFEKVPKAKKMLTVIGIYVTIIGAIIQSATLSTLLPVTVQDIGGLDIYPLTSTLSGVIGIAAMPLFGYFGAVKPSLKRPLAAAAILVGALVVLARAFAPDMMMIVIPSALYGLVSAGLYVLGYSMIRDMFDTVKAGVYLGTCGTMMAIGMLVGPTLGGVIMDFAGWRWVCHMIWPILFIGALMVFFGARIPKEAADKMARKGSKFDFTGTIVLVIFLASLILGLSLGSTFAPFGSIQSNILFVLAIVSLIGLILVIRKKKADAIVPLPALKDRNTISFSVANFFINFSNMAIFFFVPSYVILVMGLTGTEAGLTTTVYSIIGLFLSPILGRIIGKSGTARTILSAATIVRIIVAVLLVVLLTPTTNIIVVYAILFFAGFYNSAQAVCFSAGPQIQLKPDIRIQGNSAIQMSQNMGGAVGTAVYTVFIGMAGIEGGMQMALITALITAVLALLFVLRLKKLDASDEDRKA